MTGRTSASGQDTTRLLALALVVTAVSAVRPAVSYRALDLGADAIWIAVITGSFAVLSLLSAVRIGILVDRRGERPLFLVGSSLIVLASLIDGFADSLFVLPFAHMTLGLGAVCVGVSSQALAAHGGPGHERDKRFARNAVAVSLGHLIGPLIGGWVLEVARDLGWRHPTNASFAFAVLLAVGGLVIGWERSRIATGTTSAATPVRESHPVWSLVKLPGMPQALATSIAILTAVDVLVAFLPVIGEQRGISPSFVGILLSVRAGAGLLSRVGLATVVTRFGRRQTLLVNLLVAAVCFGAIPLVSVPWLLVACAAGTGLGLGVGQPLTASWVSRQAPEGRVGESLALRLTGNRLGQVVMPTVLGLVAGAAGFGAVFAISAAGLVGASWTIRGIGLDDD